MTSGHTLTFSQLVGTFTIDKETFGKQDPYVLFQSGHAKVQTKAIKNNGTLTAEWRETYTLEDFRSSNTSVLEVTVYNHNTLLPDSQIGNGTLDLSTLGGSSLSGNGDQVTIPLTDKKGKSVGDLRFYINGGGYSGRGGSSTGTGSHTGVRSGAGATGAAGAAGLASGHGHHGSGSGTGTVVGAGKGTSQTAAQQASDKAARVGHDTTTRTEAGTGTGRPVGTSVGTGVGTGTGHHHEHGHHDHSRGVGTGVSGAAVGEHNYGRGEGDVIDRKYYTGTEERAQDQALIEQYREHNPYAKDYETTVQHTGRERLVGSNVEALGTRERVIGEDHHVHSHPTAEIARNLPAGAIDHRPGGEGWVQNKAGPVCDTNTFSIAGDRTVDKERVTDLRENREFEKEFEVKTKLIGERELERGTPSEVLNRERVLVDEDKRVPCVGHPSIGSHNSGSGLTGSETRGTSQTGTGLTGSGTHTGTGYSGTGQSGTGLTGSGTHSGHGVGSGSGTHSGHGVGSGSRTGTGSGSSNQTTGEKIASFIPGSEENREKKAESGRY